MAGNSFGHIFRITTFGESHGIGLGVVIDGCPAGVVFDEVFLLNELHRRKPGQSHLTTPRDESDIPDILSGIFEGKTTGAPICLIIRNHNIKSEDYAHLKDVWRPSHADYTMQAKYGMRDYRGSGRASARETVARVMGGAVAKMVLKTYNIHIQAYVNRIGHIETPHNYSDLDLSLTEKSLVRCPDPHVSDEMIAYIEKLKSEGDSAGGVITCVIKGVPAGIGEPVFDKLHAKLGHAILSINACKGFEIGSGFEGTKRKGSEENDSWILHDAKPMTVTNNSGGIQGGISNGNDIYFKCAFKPVSTIAKKQQTLNTQLETTTLEAHGRHDPCVLPRAVPIVESMAAIVLCDFLLQHRSSKI